MNNTFNSEDNSPEQHQSYAYYSIGLSLGVLLLLTILTFISYYYNRINRQVNATTNNTNTNLEYSSSITIQVRDEVSNYPVLLYSDAKQHEPDSSTLTTSCCSICLADFKDSDLLKMLPDCGHLFHRDCVDTWLQVNLSCPVCRTSPLPTPFSTPLAQVAPLATRRE